MTSMFDFQLCIFRTNLFLSLGWLGFVLIECYLLSFRVRQTIADSAAPTNGATINSQSCASAWPPSNRAGAILRAGLTEVPVIGMQTIWMRTSVRPIAYPANCFAPFSLSVVPKTTKTKIKVNTVSAIKACRTLLSANPFAPVMVGPAWLPVVTSS